MFLGYMSLCCILTYLDYMSLCYIWIYLDYRSMCYIWTYLDYRSLCYIWTYLDYKKELVLHLDVQYLDYRSPCYSTAQIIYIKLNSYPNWDHPTPSPTGECVPSSFGSGRVGEHNRLQERE